MWESDRTLLEPDQFARRSAIQDELNRLFTEDNLPGNFGQHLSNRARALATKLDSSNDDLFTSIRSHIKSGLCPAEFASILRDLATPPSGLAYDYLDDLISGVLQFEPPLAEPHPLGPDSVFYQPTPARHIFHLIAAASIKTEDTLIDLGSGLGHVPLLVSICTGATSIGIELDPTWNAIAKTCVANLNLRNVSFLTENALNTDLSSGTVFYLYTPFTSATLATVLESLRDQAKLRPIRICTFGPCTLELAQQTWLRSSSDPDPQQITVFRSAP
jgi:hypothetical protein